MSTTQIESRWGPIEYFSKDEYVGRSLWNYGEYNPDETEYILSLAAEVPGRLCLDIGANFGVMAMALTHEGHTVEAFEPQPAVFKLLEKNVPLAKCWNVGLGATAGVGKMGKLRYSDRNNVGGLGIGTTSIYGTIDVEIKTLDSFSYADVGFMKIDVEGFEEAVLRGGTELISRCKPIMYIEDDRREKSESLHRYLKELGYTFTPHRPPLYRENNFFGRKKLCWDRNYASHNLVCRYAG